MKILDTFLFIWMNAFKQFLIWPIKKHSWDSQLTEIPIPINLEVKRKISFYFLIATILNFTHFRQKTIFKLNWKISTWFSKDLRRALNYKSLQKYKMDCWSDSNRKRKEKVIFNNTKYCPCMWDACQVMNIVKYLLSEHILGKANIVTVKKFDFQILTYLCVFKSPEFIYAIFKVMYVCVCMYACVCMCACEWTR